MARKKSRTRLSVEERRAQLLRLGRSLFATHTYEELSIDELAAQAGVSRGLLYHYFPSKRHYYIETVRAVVAEAIDRIHPDPKLPPLSQLEACLDEYIVFVDENAAIYRAVLHRGYRLEPELEEIVGRFQGLVVRWVLDSLGLEAPRPIVRTALRGWLGCIEYAMLDRVDHGDVSREQLREFLQASLFAALEAAARLDPEAGTGG